MGVNIKQAENISINVSPMGSGFNQLDGIGAMVLGENKNKSITNRYIEKKQSLNDH